MRRLAIVNAYGDENRGSAALNWAAIEAAARIIPDAEIGIVAINEFDNVERKQAFSHTLQEYPDVRILPPLLKRSSLKFGKFTSGPAELIHAKRLVASLINAETADFVESSDLVISRGGVVYTAPDGRMVNLLRRTSAMRFAHSIGIPAIHLGLHCVNVNSIPGRRIISKDFAASRLLLPRGPLSSVTARELAPSTKIWRMPDSVFGLRPLAIHRRRESASARHWGLAVTKGEAATMKELTDVVRIGVQRGLVERVTVLVQVSGGDSDHELSTLLAENLQFVPQLDVMSQELSPRDLIKEYSTLDVILSSRLHASIFGLLAGVPSFVLVPKGRPKYLDVLSEVGLAEYVLDEPTAEARFDSVDYLSRPEQIATLRERVNRAGERFDQVIKGVPEFI